MPEPPPRTSFSKSPELEIIDSIPENVPGNEIILESDNPESNLKTLYIAQKLVEKGYTNRQIIFGKNDKLKAILKKPNLV